MVKGARGATARGARRARRRDTRARDGRDGATDRGRRSGSAEAAAHLVDKVAQGVQERLAHLQMPRTGHARKAAMMREGRGALLWVECA